jgi:membrane-associated phospholipid phosphatase
MIRKLALLVSILMHPLLMPTLLFTILFYFAPIVISPISESAINTILFILLITTFLLPLLSISALVYSSGRLQDTLKNLSMQERKIRVLPFFFTTIFYGITTYMFMAKIRENSIFLIILMAITLIVLTITLITLFVKVSTHSAAASGLIGFLLSIALKHSQHELLFPLVVILLLAGLVMSARLYLNAHRPNEILLGCAVGFFLSFGTIWLFG